MNRNNRHRAHLCQKNFTSKSRNPSVNWDGCLRWTFTGVWLAFIAVTPVQGLIPGNHSKEDPNYHWQGWWMGKKKTPGNKAEITCCHCSQSLDRTTDNNTWTDKKQAVHYREEATGQLDLSKLNVDTCIQLFFLSVTSKSRSFPTFIVISWFA